MSRPRTRQRPLAVALLLLLTTASSCFTTALWDDDPPAESRSLESRRSRDDSSDLWSKLLLTPFAVALDCLTLPVQAFLSGTDDDDDDQRSRPGNTPGTRVQSHR